MKILVKEDGNNVIRLTIPTCLLINSLTSALLLHYMKKSLNRYGYDDNVNMVSLKRKELRKLISTVYSYKAKKGSLNILEVKDSDGEEVYIWL